MKNQITRTLRGGKILVVLLSILMSATAFAQFPGGGHGGHGGPGHGGGHGGPGGGHGGPGGGSGGGHPSLTCNAHFAHHRDTIVNGVRFHAAGGSGAATYAWDFGDGSTSTLQNPNYVYADTGWYYVCLTVTDTVGGGCTDTQCDSIHVFTPAPHCNAHFGVRGDTLANTANFMSHGNGPTATYSWDFGDGSGTSTDQNPAYTYGAAGIYTVCLTVSNTTAGGTCTDTYCDTINTDSLPNCPHGHGGGHHGPHRLASGTADVVSSTGAIVNLYPNPMVESSILYLENTSGNAVINIYTMSGQVVVTQSVTNGDNKISKEKLSEGLYFYSVDDNGNSIAKGKLRVY